MRRRKIIMVLFIAFLLSALMSVGVFANSAYAHDTIDEARSASSIPFSTDISGQITSEDKYDLFRVDIAESGRMSVNIHSDITEIHFSLYNSYDSYSMSGEYLQKGDNTYVYDLTAGTYYLCFERYTGTGTYSFAIAPSVSRPSFKSVTKGKKSISLKWKKLSGTSGYIIQYATNKKFTKGKHQITIKNSRTISKKIKKLKAKKKYYVRIRAYKTYEGVKYYSSWSKVRTVKTK